MPLILYPGTDMYNTITVSGLYDNNTESPLFAPTGGAVPTSGIAIGGSAPTNTNGTAFQLLSLDQSNNTLTFPGIQFVPGTAWNSGTANNTLQFVNGGTTEGPKTGAPAYVIQLDQTTTITGGAVTFQGTYDNINWVTIPTAQLLNPNTFAPQTNPYTFVASTNVPFLILSQGYAQVRIQLTTAITGTGSVTPYWSALSYEPSILSTTSSTVSGTLTNNNAAPVGNNLGVLPALAATTYTTNTYTNGNQVLLVTDLHGAANADLQAVAGVAIGSTSVVNFGSSPAAAPVQAVNSSIFSGTTALTNTGGALNVNITGSSGNTAVVGTLTNNNAAPTANNLGVLGFIAETAYNTVTYTTGDQVLAVTDLHGAVNGDVQAVAGVQLGATAVTAFGSAPAAVNVPAVNSSIFAGTTALTATGSSLNVNVTGTTGTVTVAGNLTNNNAAPAANNVGVLGYIATATPEAYTQGDQVLATTSLGGATRVVPVDEANASSLSYYSVDDGVTFTTLTNATVVPLVSIRSSSAAFIYLVRSLSTFTDGSQIMFRLYKNPTLTGATFAATAPTGSHVNFDTAATAVTAGQVVWSGYSSTGLRAQDAQLYALASGTPGDVYTLAAEKFGTGTAKAAAALQWSEQAAAL